MSAVSGTLDSLAALSGRHRVLLAVRGATPPAVLMFAWGAGGAPPLWVVVIGVALAALCAVEPDGHGALVTMAFLSWFWLAYVDDATTPWTAAASLAFLALHAASALATTSPGAATPDPLIWARWRRRVLVVSWAIVVAWVAATVLGALNPPGSAVVTAGTLLLLTGFAWWLRSHSSRAT